LVTAATLDWIADCMIFARGGLMRTLILSLGATAALALGAFGCSHSLNEAKANYHQDRADSAAEHGDYYKAESQQHKADVEQHKADTAPLP
jgi:hypothetical protein